MTEQLAVISTIDDRGVATVTLNKPELHNAFDEHVISQLIEAFTTLNNNSDVRAVILAAKGKSFCAGADLNWMRKMASYSYEENKQDAGQLAELYRTLFNLNKPTIARVQGAVFGGGVGLVACCDIAIGTRMSKFCLSEVKLGLVPATISPYVIEAIGPRLAKRYFMTAEVFSSRRARRIGLLSETVSEDDLDTTIESLISALLNNGPDSVSKAKALVNQISYQSIDSELIEQTSELIANVRVSNEGQEGLSAFLEKRAPTWKKA
ncbi:MULTISPECIES: enoyl-CoA hydratase/isomerase family protein [Alteromonadaceae]|jgi:methylglutaconyl-CoA hydratase|uniref:Enoyl-CoA hydratase/isomerase family protein n=1 Tax=Brumicola blandensis TaxID=3075611 RepID=A0AAW8QVY1_9ALTE|nr:MULTISPECIES: enoyl-CoA hydratase/isomerase family protein [unclassified Alteromonas]MDT0581328.1 enoyl-CoA hydratase/isomerase family protein [Alteromonas sp. W409]MDT0626956.1 enoyl-CoA hydratase/isomerase family protein [Alteromonas sp. W364]